jgi:hypothetical protein
VTDLSGGDNESRKALRELAGVIHFAQLCWAVLHVYFLNYAGAEGLAAPTVHAASEKVPFEFRTAVGATCQKGQAKQECG